MDEDAGQDELWPGTVGFGFYLGVPIVATEVGLRPMGPGVLARWAKEWTDALQDCARALYPTARAVLQPGEGFDHFGDRQIHAMVWFDTKPIVDIEAMRRRFEENDHHVSTATYYYDPAMA
jgi:hypothetical protein